MRGLTGKSALFTFKNVKGKYIVHQMKDMNVLYLLVYLILRKSEGVENCL